MAQGNWQRAAVNSPKGRQPKQPRPVPRPGLEPPKKTAITTQKLLDFQRRAQQRKEAGSNHV